MGNGKQLAGGNSLGTATVNFFAHSIEGGDGSKKGLVDKQEGLGKDNANEEAVIGDSIETGVWLVNYPLFADFHEELMREVNHLPFIGSSQDVGANTKKKHGTIGFRVSGPMAGCSSCLQIPC